MKTETLSMVTSTGPFFVQYTYYERTGETTVDQYCSSNPYCSSCAYILSLKIQCDYCSMCFDKIRYNDSHIHTHTYLYKDTCMWYYSYGVPALETSTPWIVSSVPDSFCIPG